MTLVRVISFAVGAALILPAGASADRTVVPPGHAGGNQYVETIPGAGGEDVTTPVHQSPGGGGPGGNSSGGQPGGTGGATTSPTTALGAKTAKRFEGAGPAGKATADLAAATDATSKISAQAKRHDASARHASARGESPLKQIAGHLTGTSGDSGMGLLLPLLILMSAVLAIGFIFGRRRPSQPRS